jgi:VIT1/CCC1 family predicted Fe2+/Mn2+ transporter
LVNVLGLSLGLFAAHASSRVIVVAGLAAGFSEAVSMGAVAYTSASADANRLANTKDSSLVMSAVVVGFSALVCAFLPILPFLFVPVMSLAAAVIGAIILSMIILFAFGVARARMIGGSQWRSGLQILLIGIVSAFAGFLIGLVLKID